MRVGNIGSGGSDIIILDEGLEKTDALTSMNFVGAGVTVSGGDEGIVVVTIAGEGAGTGFNGVVENWDALNALPAADHNNEIYYVMSSTGFWPWNKRSGVYTSNGVTWSRSGNATLQVLDTESTMSDDADNTKQLGWQLSSIPTETKIIITAPSIDLNLNAIPAANSVVTTIGTPTYNTLQEMFSLSNSAGAEKDSMTYISDAGGGSINVAAGKGLIRTTDAKNGALVSFEWSASNGIAIPNNTLRYVGVEYNSGSPQVTVRTTRNWNDNTDFELGEVVNEEGVLHLFENPTTFNDNGGRIVHRLYETTKLQRSTRIGGLIIGETGTRNITVTAGELYDKLNKFLIAAIDTSISGGFDSYSSGGLESSANTQWDNGYYDNAGTLTALTVNWYTALWWYIEADGALICVYGTSQYSTAAAAQTSSPPTVLPLRIQSSGVLIGRFTIRQGGSTTVSISSAFTTVFNASLVSDHGNLAGLSDNDHPQYLLNSVFDANTVIAANVDNTPVAVTLAEQTILGRIASGNIKGLTATEIRTLINVENGADVTDASNVDSSGAVMEADYNANTILAATADDTPAALTVPEQTLVGRIPSGNIDALTIAEVIALLFHEGTEAPADTTKFWIDTN